MKSIVMFMDSDREYTEPEINALLKQWNRDITPAIDSDHVTVRRMLIDYGHLERTPDGGRYRIGFPPRPLAFDLEVDDIDLRSTVAAYLDYSERQKRARHADHSA
jgi:hypothetical protein